MIVDILLSPILIFVVFLFLLLLVTRWAFDQRELPAYALGWMVGLFMIIVYQSLSGEAAPPEPDAVSEAVENGFLTLEAILVPSFVGFGAGVTASTIYRYVAQTHARRSIAVAIITAALVFTLFLILSVSQEASKLFGVLALAFGIGVLGTSVIGAGTGASAPSGRGIRKRPRDYEPPPPPRPRPKDNSDDPLNADRPVDGAEVPEADLDRARNRFDQLRKGRS
ncbi:MAG: hypothetical protein EA396_10385 [Anaerolineaceae bacterium]|nr:MAG: hypothetical protein EA396_10385 [Anaerolineaceae bacterium]